MNICCVCVCVFIIVSALLWCVIASCVLVTSTHS